MKPFDKGYTDFKSGQVSNPHPTNTNMNREWERGFNTAYFENLERIKNEEQVREGS